MYRNVQKNFHRICDFFVAKHMTKRSGVSFVILYIYDKMKKTRESERTDDRY